MEAERGLVSYHIPGREPHGDVEGHRHPRNNIPHSFVEIRGRGEKGLVYASPFPSYPQWSSMYRSLRSSHRIDISIDANKEQKDKRKARRIDPEIHSSRGNPNEDSSTHTDSHTIKFETSFQFIRYRMDLVSDPYRQLVTTRYACFVLMTTRLHISNPEGKGL